MKLKLLIIAFVFGAGTISAQTHEVIAVSGNYSENSNVSLSWTLGEGIIETHENSNIILTQGFQQNSYTITSIEGKTIEIDISAFPNPTSDLLRIKVGNDVSENLFFELIDISGRTLIIKNLKDNISVFDMQEYVPGNYLLRIRNKENNINKIYKIIKK